MIIAIDTGGTKTLVASYNEAGEIIGTPYKFPTPPVETDYVKALTDYLEATFDAKDVDAVVIAIPGIIKDGVAVWCNNLKWKNFDVAGAFKGLFNGAPLYVDNDANLAGLAETRQLDPMPISSLYVTVSTGIGSGIITNGVIDPGLRYSEAGRSLVEFDGEVREWESFASGKAIYNTYGKFARDIHDPETWRAIADRISRGFLAIIPVLQPDVIIIGGSIGTYFERYDSDLTAILKDKLPDHIGLPRLVQAQHPEEAVIYGCYYYALDALAA
ncbi:ROK family protein [Candidatus Saccharibacteria bacterium]|nr:ROK family protein [Candidatus Saccharibacteria bacterium]